MIVEPRILPVLLLSEGQLVKTKQFSDPVYVGDPVNVLSIFNDFEVDEIVLLDINASHQRTPCDLGQLRHYAEECFIPMAYGGGLTTLAQVAGLFKAGYEKAVLNTAIQEDPNLVTQAVARFGSQAIVASIDVMTISGAPTVMTRGGTNPTGVSPTEWALNAAELGVGEILLTSIDREGTSSGFDLDLIRSVTNIVDVPVIAHGGAGQRKHLSEPLRQSGASAAAAGRLFVFQGKRGGVLINFPSRNQVERLISAGIGL